MAYKRYFADFETTTSKINKDRADVGLWSITDINTEWFKEGLALSKFFETCNESGIKWLYFHDLSLKGDFIINWLTENYYIPTNEVRPGENQFTFLRNGEGDIYSIDIKLEKFALHIRDSLKLMPRSVHEMGELLNLPQLEMNKEINYTLFKDVEKVPKMAINYIRRNVSIVAKFYKEFSAVYGNGKITIASTAYESLKKWYGFYNFTEDFGGRIYSKIYKKRIVVNKLKQKDYDEMLIGYKGGFVFVNEKYKGKDVYPKKLGYVSDIHSSYSYVLANVPMPYGSPLKFKPKGEHRTLYKILIFDAKLKTNMIPFLSDNGVHGKFSFKRFKEVHNEVYVFTERELELVKKHYEMDFVILHTWYFRAKILFKGWIEDIYKRKQKSKNKLEKDKHKLILNAPTGKFTQRHERITRELVHDPKSELNGHRYGEYVEVQNKTRNDLISYLPVGIFYASEARCNLLDAVWLNIDQIVYGDTDSMVTIGKPRGIKITKNKMGTWGIENTWTRGRFLGSKEYMLQLEDGTFKRAISGLTTDKHGLINFGNFRKGYVIEKAKLVKIRVPGGIHLKYQKHTL